MFSNFDKNYFERILGYELFTIEREQLERKLNIKLIYHTELAIFYDLLAKVYLNALTNRKYPISVAPLFYLQLDSVRKSINDLEHKHINAFSEHASVNYIETRFAKEIAAIELRFSLLANYIIRYRNQRFNESSYHKLIAFMDTMRLRAKPNWLKVFENIPSELVFEEPLVKRLARSDVGQNVLVLRPYTIRTDGDWAIEKVPVLFGKNKGVTGRVYFDIFLVHILDKRVTMEGIETLTGEAEFGLYQFTGEVPPCRILNKATPTWKMSYTDKVTKETVEEVVPFYELCDFQRINKTLGKPLDDYQLKRLIEDAEFQIATLG